MREAVRPCQVVKWTLLVVLRKVDDMGLKTVPWSNDARSAFVWCAVMDLCALCMWLLVSMVRRVLGGSSGMFHRPLVLL